MNFLIIIVTSSQAVFDVDTFIKEEYKGIFFSPELLAIRELFIFWGK